MVINEYFFTTQLEAKYMRLRQLTGELRGKDMEVGRLLEDKMRILAEILEEQGIQPPPLPHPLRYTLLVQEREKSLTKEELLQASLCFVRKSVVQIRIFRYPHFFAGSGSVHWFS